MFWRFRYKKLHLDLILSCGEGAVLYLQGFPSFPKENDFTEFLEKKDISVLLPHYLGSWLSDGRFTPENCILTVEESLEFLKKGRARELYNFTTKKWSTKNIILAGHSFGGTIFFLALLKIKTPEKIFLASPLIDLENQAKSAKEEKMDKTLNFARKVFKNGYRGIREKVWDDFFKNNFFDFDKDFEKIKNKNFFIVHGDSDPVVSVEHTRRLVREMKKRKIKVCYFEIKGGGHKIEDLLTEKMKKEFGKWIKT